MDDTRDLPSEVGVNVALLLAGALIGAAATLLLSPGSRQDLRVRAVGAAGNWKQQAAEALAEGRERVITAVERSQDRDGGKGPSSDRGPVKPA